MASGWPGCYPPLLRLLLILGVVDRSLATRGSVLYDVARTFALVTSPLRDGVSTSGIGRLAGSFADSLRLLAGLAKPSLVVKDAKVYKG